MMSSKLLSSRCKQLVGGAVAVCSALLFQSQLFAQGEAAEKPALNPTQIEAIKKQVKLIRDNLKNASMSRNGSAEQVFRAASSDPKRTLELYLNCIKKLNFDDQEKEDREWREWRDQNEERHEFEPFVRGLQLQLHYLSLVTRASQEEDIATIFPDLLKFMSQLGSLPEAPHPVLNSNINGTVFARAYELDAALNRKDDEWEMNPMRIGGVYEKTILPYLRTKLPQNLDNAWGQRIEQETRMAALFLALEEKMERFAKRNEGEGRQVQGEVRRMVGYVEDQARRSRDFKEERLPVLEWSRARDQFQHVNAVSGARAMLDVIQGNMTHDNVEDWVAQFEEFVLGEGEEEEE